MKPLNAKHILDQNPTELHRVVNQIGQEVIFYEHPTRGEDSPVLALVDKKMVKTEFFDLDDFYEGSEYLPISFNGDVECAFHFEDNEKFKALQTKAKK